MKKTLTLSLLFIAILSQAQDGSWFNMMNVNPAFTGFKQGHDFGIRTEYSQEDWYFDGPASPENRPCLTEAFYNFRPGGSHSGFGIILRSDHDYPYSFRSNRAAGLNYAYHIKAGNAELAFGSEAAINQVLFDPEMSHPIPEKPDKNSRYYFTSRAGSAVTYKGFNGGIVLHNLFQTDKSHYSSSKLIEPPGIFVHTGFIHRVKKNGFMFPFLNYFRQGQGTDHLQVGVQGGGKHFTTGMMLLTTDNLDFSVNAGLLFGNFKAGYTYHTEPFYATHRFSLGMRIRGKKQEIGEVARLYHRLL